VTEPERYIGSKGLKAELLASAKADRAPDGSRRRALVAAAAAVAASTKAASATAALSTLARVAAWKWIAMGALSVGAVVAAKEVIVPRATTVEATRAPSAAPPTPPTRRTRQALAPVRPGAPTPIAVAPDLPVPVSPPPAPVAVERASPPPPPAAKAEPPPIAPKATVVAAQVTEAPTPARATAPSTSGSRLAAEITAIDQMKSALAAGDAADALRRVDAYRAAFPTGTLAAEATALRVEALARAGRRDDARAELARLRAGHPESPLLENLGQIVGE
jgi:hypothetical protein